MSWSLKEIYKALNKKFKHTENLKFQKVSIDSRKINSKDFFIPIVGENYDGHNFIDEVSNFGVKACLVEKKKLFSSKSFNSQNFCKEYPAITSRTSILCKKEK